MLGDKAIEIVLLILVSFPLDHSTIHCCFCYIADVGTSAPDSISFGSSGRRMFLQGQGGVPNGTNPSRAGSPCMFIQTGLGERRDTMLCLTAKHGTRASINYRKDSSLPIVMKSLTEEKTSGRAYDRMETEPGFDKLVNNRSGLKTAINRLLSIGREANPQHAHRTTSLFVFATAGVRGSVLLIQAGFWVMCGLYWRSPRSLVGGSVHILSPDMSQRCVERSVVNLLKRQPDVNKSDLIGGKLEMKHPGQYICSQCAPSVRRRKKGKTGVPIKLVGAPNWGECSALAKLLLIALSGQTRNVERILVPFLMVTPPASSRSVLRCIRFFVVYRFFNLSAEASLDDVLEKVGVFVKRLGKLPEPYCFRAPYIVSLLREGLYITDKQIVIGPYIWFARLIASASLCTVTRVSNCMPRFFRKSYLPLFRHSSASLNIPSPFKFQRWSPMSPGVKTPLSPTVRVHRIGHVVWKQHTAHGVFLIVLIEQQRYAYLGECKSTVVVSFWSSPRRSQMRLQSRRSQSREDLSSSLAESHMLKM
ncbi:hypothetical protein HID58_077933 [Brassica napus]|uniref:apyrase n=1 Tax=Brassica napus TaxID=3708 RepID=A0ABQ7YTL6_BRANA|nr:hypothetical protein HID58_077933 [Brassica napus]